MVIAAMIICCANAHALWSPDWQVEFTDELDSGGVVLKDKYAVGAAFGKSLLKNLVDKSQERRLVPRVRNATDAARSF